MAHDYGLDALVAGEQTYGRLAIRPHRSIQLEGAVVEQEAAQHETDLEQAVHRDMVPPTEYLRQAVLAILEIDPEPIAMADLLRRVA
jgi:hypothetical protein